MFVTRSRADNRVGVASWIARTAGMQTGTNPNSLATWLINKIRPHLENRMRIDAVIFRCIGLWGGELLYCSPRHPEVAVFVEHRHLGGGKPFSTEHANLRSVVGGGSNRRSIGRSSLIVNSP